MLNYYVDVGPEYPAFVVLVSQLIWYALVCSKYEDCSCDIGWFKNYCVRDILHINLILLLWNWNCMFAIPTLITFVTSVERFVHRMWHMTGFRLLCVNLDGCHLWGRQFCHHHIICQYWEYVYVLMTASSSLLYHGQIFYSFLYSHSIVFRVVKYVDVMLLRFDR